MLNAPKLAFPSLSEVQKLTFGVGDLVVVSALEKGQFGVVGGPRSTWAWLSMTDYLVASHLTNLSR